MTLKTKCIGALIFLCIVDVVIPIPILGLILLYALLQKPPWFAYTVREIYSQATLWLLHLVFLVFSIDSTRAVIFGWSVSLKTLSHSWFASSFLR